MATTQLFIPPEIVASQDSVPLLYSTDNNTTTPGVDTEYQLVISGTPADGTGFTVGPYAFTYESSAEPEDATQISTAGGPSVTVLGDRTLAAIRQRRELVGVFEAGSNAAGTINWFAPDAAPLAVADTSPSLAISVLTTGNAPVFRPAFQLLVDLYIEAFRGADPTGWNSGDEQFYIRVGTSQKPAQDEFSRINFDLGPLLRAYLGFDIDLNEVGTAFFIKPCILGVRKYWWAVSQSANDTGAQGKYTYANGGAVPDPEFLAFNAQWGRWESLIRPLTDDGCPDTSDWEGPAAYNAFASRPSWLTSGPIVPWLQGSPFFGCLYQAADPRPVAADLKIYGTKDGSALAIELVAALSPTIGACSMFGHPFADADKQVWQMQLSDAIETLAPQRYGCIFLADGTVTYSPLNLFTDAEEGTFESPGFDSGIIANSTTGMINSVAEDTAAQAHTGTRSYVRSFDPDPEASAGAVIGHTTGFNLAADTYHRIRAWVRVAQFGTCSAGNNINIQLAPATGFTIVSQTDWVEGVDPLNTWVQIELVVLVGATQIDDAHLIIELGQDSYCGSVEVYVDDISVELGNVEPLSSLLEVRPIKAECDDEIMAFAFQNRHGFIEAFYARRERTRVQFDREQYDNELTRFPAEQANDHQRRNFQVAKDTVVECEALELPPDCGANWLDFAASEHVYVLVGSTAADTACDAQEGEPARWVPIIQEVKEAEQQLISGSFRPNFSFRFSEVVTTNR